MFRLYHICVLQDFGDGGAFPEILVAQFPLNMGADVSGKQEGGKTLALQYDKDGKLRHDAIAKIGHDKSKVSVFITGFSCLKFLF